MRIIVKIKTTNGEYLETFVQFWNISDQCVRLFFPIGDEIAKKLNQIHNFIEKVVFATASDKDAWKGGPPMYTCEQDGYTYSQFESVQYLEHKFFCIHLDRYMEESNGR